MGTCTCRFAVDGMSFTSTLLLPLCLVSETDHQIMSSVQLVLGTSVCLCVYICIVFVCMSLLCVHYFTSIVW